MDDRSPDVLTDWSTVPTVIRIISFGYLHGVAPPADITLDLRHHFRDPHVNPEFRNKTANDFDVREAVRKTPGIWNLITATCTLANAYLEGPSTGGLLTIAVGCAGGRHRAAAVAMALAEFLGGDFEVTLEHRDLAKDVVER